MSHSYGHRLDPRYLPKAMPEGFAQGLPPDLASRAKLEKGWQYLGFQYHATRHPLYPFPARIVSLVRRTVDPLFVPLWVRTRYLSPAGAVVYFDNMVIAAGVLYPSAPLHRDLRNLLLPEGRLFVQPHEPLRVMECPRDECPRSFAFAPGHTIPMGWGLLYHMQAMRAAMLELDDKGKGDSASRVDQAASDYERAEFRSRDEDMDKLEKEIDYRWDQNWDYMRRNAEALDVDDRKAVGVAGAQMPSGGTSVIISKPGEAPPPTA